MIELIEAAKNNDIEKIETLSLQNQFDPNIKDDKGYTPLMWAAHSGHLNAFNKLLEKGAKLNLKDINHSTIMHFAAGGGCIPLLKILADQGFNYLSVNKKGRKPIHYAASYNKKDEAIIFLLIKGANVNEKDNEGKTPLHMAAYNNNPSTIQILLKCGAKLDALDDDGQTPLMIAGRYGNFEIFQALVDKGADYTLTNPAGINVLHFVAEGGNVEIMQMLAKKGVNFKITNKNNSTLLHYATIKNKDAAMIDFLLSKGISINCKNIFNFTPLFYAIDHDNAEMVSILMKQGAMIDHSDNEKTALMFAAEKGNLTIFNLLQGKSDHKIKTSDETNIMHFASKGGNVVIMQLLAADGFDFITVDKNGSAPIHYAAAFSTSADVIPFLLSQGGVSINAKDKYGGTPLHAAVESNNLKMISILCQQGAVIDALNNALDAPIHLAHNRINLMMVEELIKQGSKIDYKNYSLFRLCANILNVNRLNDCLKKNNIGNFTDGGYIEEARSTIKVFLLLFIAEKKLNKNDFQHLLDGFDFIENKKLLKNASKEKFFFSSTGHKFHIFYFSVRKESTQYQLSFAELGGFAKRVNSNSNQTYPFFSLSVSEKDLEKVLDKFSDARNLTRDLAYSLIFTEIPKLVGEDYQYSSDIELSFENGRCYFENLKSSTKCELKKMLGADYGIKFYEEFVLSMEKKALLILQTLPFEGKDEVIQSIQIAQNNKIEKLEPEQRDFIRRMH